LKFGGIKEVAVSVRGEVTDNKYLCAYFVSENECRMSELREYLSNELPNYMIPSYFVQMEKMPLTPNGKIDKKALPEPGVEVGEAYIAPGNEIEEKLVEIWSDLLGMGKDLISINSDFFRIGGHSLNAIIMTSKIHKAFDVNIGLADLFKTPTIKEIASMINVVNWANKDKADINQEREVITI
jgi:acyl carrier protein